MDKYCYGASLPLKLLRLLHIALPPQAPPPLLLSRPAPRPQPCSPPLELYNAGVRPAK